MKFGPVPVAEAFGSIVARVVRRDGLVPRKGQVSSRGRLPIIGAPGCARSLVENGFDGARQRIQADVPIKASDTMGMGVGGLLMEIASRPQPRLGDG